MKALVIFGSKSDERIYSPLIKSLESQYSVDFKVLSAHRDPEALDKRLEQGNFDFVIAGAGLSAHLPGVIAAKTSKPVFGIPVDAQFGGLDAVLSISQMPFGVPVVSTGTNDYKWCLPFLNNVIKKESLELRKINIVINFDLLNYEYVNIELNRTKEYAMDKEIDLTIIEEVIPGELNIVLVDQEEEIDLINGSLHIPLLEKAARTQPKQAVKIFEWMEKGGLWLGVNNTRNALAFLLKWG